MPSKKPPIKTVIDKKLHGLLNCSRVKKNEISRNHRDVLDVLMKAGFEKSVSMLLIQCCLERENRDNPRCARQVANLLNAKAYKQRQSKAGEEKPPYKSVLKSLKLEANGVRVDAPLTKLNQDLFDRVLKAGGWGSDLGKPASHGCALGTVRAIAKQEPESIKKFLDAPDSKVAWTIASVESYFTSCDPDNDDGLAKKLGSCLRTVATNINQLRIGELEKKGRIELVKKATPGLEVEQRRVISSFVDLVISGKLNTVKRIKAKERSTSEKQ